MTSHAPFSTAGFGWIWLEDTAAWSTLAASLLARVDATITAVSAARRGAIDLLKLILFGTTQFGLGLVS